MGRIAEEMEARNGKRSRERRAASTLNLFDLVVRDLRGGCWDVVEDVKARGWRGSGGQGDRSFARYSSSSSIPMRPWFIEVAGVGRLDSMGAAMNSDGTAVLRAKATGAAVREVSPSTGLGIAHDGQEYIEILVNGLDCSARIHATDQEFPCNPAVCPVLDAQALVWCLLDHGLGLRREVGGA